MRVVSTMVLYSINPLGYMEYIYAANKRTMETKHNDSTPDKVFIVIIRTIPQHARWFSNITQTQTDALQ